MTDASPTIHHASPGFPVAAAGLEKFGLKFTGGGAHISRTMMLTELDAVLAAVPEGSDAADYREAIFAEPEQFSSNSELEDLAVKHVREACLREDAGADSVVAVIGLASLFDFMRVSSLIERIEDGVQGRLLVFFPGEYSGQVYRFMDARDGFNYLAVPITSAESFINS